MATITSTQTGDWDTGSTWVGGVAPVGTDDVVIASGHVVTKNSVAASPDFALITVTGTLVIAASKGLKTTTNNTPQGSGEIQMNAGSTFEIYGHRNATLKWTIAGAAGDYAHVTASNEWLEHGNLASSFSFAKFSNPSNRGVLMDYFSIAMEFVDCAFERGGAQGTAYLLTGCDGLTFRRCFFYSGTVGVNAYLQTTHTRFYDCVFGEDEDGGAATNSTADLVIDGLAPDCASRSELHGCRLESATPVKLTRDLNVVSSQDHQGVQGDWRTFRWGGDVFRSTASKKTGDYGVEMVPSANCSTARTVWVDIPIPVESGDTVAPSIYVKNVTADLDLQDAAGRMTFELDPGNAWGLNEPIDADTLADVYNNWRQVSFTGGTAGGSSAKGTVILRITLARYVATGVVYVADLAGTGVGTYTFAYGNLYGPTPDPGAAAGGGLLVHAGMAGGMRG